MVKLKKDCNTGGCDNVFSCCYWKEKINRAWELATTSVRSIKVNGGEPQYPDGDGAVDVKVTVDTTEIQNQIEAISSEVDQLTSDVMDNSTDIINLSNLKENVLSAGDGIDIDRASSSTPIISTNVVAQNSDGMFSVWKNETKIAELTEGENVSISPTGEVSAVDTKYTAGANVTITADNVISATGELSGTASADQILLNDNRSVQSAIDAIEDEIGDSSTGGTIQSRLEALEESTANLDAEMAGKQDNLSANQLLVVNNQSLQKGYFFDGATANENKFQLVAHPTNESSTAISMKPGSNVTFTVDSKDNIKINVDLNDVESSISDVETIASSNASEITVLKTDVSAIKTDVNNLKNADKDLSKAYNGFEVNKGGSGKVGITMSAVDGMTSASQDIITAGDNIAIVNGVISASGGGIHNSITTIGSIDAFTSALRNSSVGSILAFRELQSLDVDTYYYLDGANFTKISSNEWVGSVSMTDIVELKRHYAFYMEVHDNSITLWYNTADNTIKSNSFLFSDFTYILTCILIS